MPGPSFLDLPPGRICRVPQGNTAFLNSAGTLCLDALLAVQKPRNPSSMRVKESGSWCCCLWRRLADF